MANNLTGLNLATRAGEGGADVLSFGQLDRAANLMYQEQKQKEAQGYKEYQLGQQELSKDFSKVRSADIPDLMDRYNVLKQKKQKLLFDPKIKNDAIAFAEAQKEANLAEAELRNLMAESVEVKELDNQITKRLSTNRDEFDDEKVPTLFEAFKMPTSQRKEKNLIGAEPFRYTGMDMKGLADLSKSAMGTLQKVPFGQEVETDGGYNFEQKFIGRTNDPVQYATNMYKGMQTNKYTQGARASLSQMSPIQINQIQSAYNAIPDAEFEAKWGRKKEDLLKAFSANPDDKVGQYVTLDAMQYAVNNMPKEVESKRRKNDKFVDEKKYEDWLKKNKITSSQATRRAYISRAANGKENEPVFYYDSYGEIDKKLDSKKGGSGIAINELSATTQENVLNIAKKSLGQSNVDNSEITIAKDANGEIGLYKVNIVEDKQGKNTAYVGEKISKLTDLDLNYSNAPSVKEKREISQKQNSGKKEQPKSTKKVVGKKDDKL